MALVVKTGGEKMFPKWKAALQSFLPDLPVYWWEDPAVRPEDVRYALVWDPEPGRLAGFAGLELIISSGAGVDFITRNTDWDRRIPLVRMGGAETAQRMGEYIAWACLSLLRDGRRIATAQAKAHWEFFESEFTAQQRRVGILGLGNLGAKSAAMLQGLGFPVIGWSRSRKALPGVESYAGPEELDAFLAASDILVCLLPSTPETVGIIDAGLLARLPRGAGLVNAGRGTHAKLDDVLAAVESGQLSGAVLDVFDPEPLPPEHPLWAHSRIIVTPHVASLASLQERARYVADAITARRQGGALPNLYDPVRGY